MAVRKENRIPNVLSIAGVDPSGGAGLLEDVKTMSACGVYACGVVTALTAQNTRGVSGVCPVPAEFVSAQLDTLFSDVRIDAVKIGMLNDAAVIEAVARAIGRFRPAWVVLDPVMVAKSGDRLLQAEALDALRTHLLPLASLVTPNIPEAADLLGISESRIAADPQASARALWEMLRNRHAWVLLKGGHLKGEAVDRLVSGAVAVEFSEKRIETQNSHGTGCTLSSAIAAELAKTGDMIGAVRQAKRFITEAIRHAGVLSVGGGHGPTHAFWLFWPEGEKSQM